MIGIRVGIFLVAYLAITTNCLESFSSVKFNEKIENVIPAYLEEGVFQTRLDHFRPLDTRMVNFTYHVNNDHYLPGGPFYIYIKDFMDITTEKIQSGLMIELAEQTGAALLTFDHRYFGTNIPVSDFSLENLQFLTIEQILGDIIEFVQYVRRGQASTPVILWGSGFGGTLAAWTRKKYPHLVNAVWSSSGLFELTVTTESYYDMLENILITGGGLECRAHILNSLNAIDDLVKQGKGEELQKQLNLCHPVATDSEDDIASLYELYLGFITDYINEHHTIGSQNFCRDVGVFQNESLRAFVRWARFIYNGDDTCFDHSFEHFVERNQNISALLASRAGHFLRCTQLGLLPITEDWLWLPNRVQEEHHYRKCEGIFGEYDPKKLTIAVNGLILHFGSLAQRLTNVVYTNGALDPYILHGMIFSRDLNATIVNIPHHAKSADLTENNGWDPVELIEAKQHIEERILAWSAEEATDF